MTVTFDPIKHSTIEQSESTLQSWLVEQVGKDKAAELVAAKVAMMRAGAVDEVVEQLAWFAVRVRRA